MTTLLQMPTLPVSEIFGPTIQGEGPDIGKACAFLRFHLCPVQCPGCDTAYTWNGTETGFRATIDEILERLKPYQKGQMGLVVSGGEPMLYRTIPGFYRLTLFDWRWSGLETSGYAGTVQPQEIGRFLDWLANFETVCVSPKITPCLHGDLSDEILESNIHIFRDYSIRNRVYWKFVARDEKDIDAILACLDRNRIRMGRDDRPIYLMPYGQEAPDILRTIELLIPFAEKYGWIITPRLHALLWGKRRGV